MIGGINKKLPIPPKKYNVMNSNPRQKLNPHENIKAPGYLFE